jgi:2,4-dienoyl-CoA reductase-like NADH-dependent reductase (Old Yellow Enzyme family)/pyruvate/2-oxoglutarate dehydrogenase complex dihydrolipoamide dehydrogenase (E3) component
MSQEDLKFNNLFKEISIGKVQLRNRIVMSPMVMCYATSQGEINEQVLSHFEARARGGVGLIIVESSYVHPLGKGFESEIAIDRDSLIPTLHMLTNLVKVYGSAIAIQLYHAGIQACVEQPVGPSAIGRKVFPSPRTPRELTTTEVEELVEYFADAALRAKKAGFDMVEVHGSHGYLIAEFLSPLTNRRTDKYGADKILFAYEIIRRIKEKCCEDYPILFRLASCEFEEGGITVDYAKKIAKRLEDAGVDAFDITGGTKDTSDHIIPPAYYETQGYFFKNAYEIKKVVNVPVISGGMIIDPNIADEAIGNGIVDLVFIGRQLLADPEWPKKVKEGKLNEIRPCTACDECIGSISLPAPVICSVNPLKGFEYKFLNEDELPKAETRKKVFIVGGGVAGLEAARISSMRGHDVILFEESNVLGGITNLVLNEKYKTRIKKLIEWYINVLKSSKVTIKTNTKVTPKILKEEKPDVVILATGSEPLIPKIPGIENCVLAEDVFAGKVNVGNNIVIIGGGLVGCELALKLAEEGKKVTIVEALPLLARDEPRQCRLAILRLLQKLEVNILTNSPVVEIRRDSVDIVDNLGKRTTIYADTIVLSVGRIKRLDNGLLESAKSITNEVYIIGDAMKPRKIKDAIREGFWTAISI